MARYSDENYVQLKVLVPKDLKAEFQKKCIDEEVNMSEKVEELLRMYLDKNTVSIRLDEETRRELEVYLTKKGVRLQEFLEEYIKSVLQK